jgi:hypothetical protein
MVAVNISPAAKRIVIDASSAHHDEITTNFEFLCALIASPHDDFVYSDVIGQLPGWAGMIADDIHAAEVPLSRALGIIERLRRARLTN